MSSPGPKAAAKKGMGRGRGRAGALQAAAQPRGESLRRPAAKASTEGPLRFAIVQKVAYNPEPEL